MGYRITARGAGLAILACLALTACKHEQEEDAVTRAPAPDVSVASIGTTEWPPASAAEGVVLGQSGTDPFAENNMIVLDMSGSMGEGECSGDFPNRAAAAKEALLGWITANPGDNVGLVSFSPKGIELDMPLGRGEAHARAVVERIRSLQPGEGTPLLTAMTMARNELEKQAVRQGGTGAYRMIVITDGQANRGEDPTPLVDEIVGNPANMTEIHTLGFCISGRHSLKDPERVFYTDANSPEALRAGLDSTRGEADDFDASALNFEELSQ